MDASVFRALADPNRLAIIGLLHDRVHCVKAMSYKLGLSESSISQHLKVLRDAGLVEGVKYGYYTHYRLDRNALEALGQALCDMAQRPGGDPECDAAEVVGCETAQRRKKQDT